MERHAARELEILNAIGSGETLTQRALAQRLGVALGLVNLYVQALAKKGYIKVAEFPQKPAVRKRFRYLLTARGLAEKTRLTYEYMAYSLSLYRRARATLREALGPLSRNGATRLALLGTGEAAELAYLTLKEFGLEPIGIFDHQVGQRFLGLPVRDVTQLKSSEFDAVILATFDRPEHHVQALVRLGIPRRRILTLRQLATAGAGTFRLES
jgi:DNA-binding MarR family transcriptional regulator